MMIYSNLDTTCVSVYMQTKVQNNIYYYFQPHIIFELNFNFNCVKKSDTVM